MSAPWKSLIGQQIYEALLPEIYRNRDNNRFSPAGDISELGDLARYLDACGELFDSIRHTLDQRLADNFPDNNPDGASCQEWLIPYFARLVDARLLSPDAAGRRDEVANAVSWRQRKGTLRCVEDIAESVGRVEAEIQEAWKRVAHTARVDMPLIPASAYGETEPDARHPLAAARHPALPTAMLDLRDSSRAVCSDSGRADELHSRFNGIEQSWRRLHPRGVACFPNSFEDVSPRTVDLRSANWGQGHYHPARLLVYVPAPAGFFHPDQQTLAWAGDLTASPLLQVSEEDGVLVYRGLTLRPLCLNGAITLTETRAYRFEHLVLTNKLTVSFGSLELRDVIATHVEVRSKDPQQLLFRASDCLLGRLSVASGLSRIERCTVLGNAVCLNLDAVDSLFHAALRYDKAIDEPPRAGSIRYCRVPVSIGGGDMPKLLNVDDTSITHDEPEFFSPLLAFQGGAGAKTLRENGVAVLKPGCPTTIVQGAKNGGELGYFNRGRGAFPVRVNGNHSLSFPTEDAFLLYDLVFTGAVTADADQTVMACERVAIRSLTVNGGSATDDSGKPLPVLDARDCLFDSLQLATGLGRLEYVTVMKTATLAAIQASDCLFAGGLDPGLGGCVRYSRIPQDLSETASAAIGALSRAGTNTRLRPVFLTLAQCGESRPRTPQFGESGYGVLHPATPQAIRFGAEDHGELGAYHHKHLCLSVDAVRDKLTDYLPVTLEPVVIYDERLNHLPPMTQGDAQ